MLGRRDETYGASALSRRRQRQARPARRGVSHARSFSPFSALASAGLCNALRQAAGSPDAQYFHERSREPRRQAGMNPRRQAGLPEGQKADRRQETTRRIGESPVVRVLGPLEVTSGAGTVSLPPRVAGVLALLSCRAGRVVPAGVLIDALWGETPPRTAGKELAGAGA
jgi:hypothetical protein